MARDPDAAPFRLLFVCLGNVCRSPLAAAIARQQACKLRVRDLVVESAGLLEEGRPASFEAEQVAAERKMSLVGHLSRKATPDLVSRFDLVLTMEPDHIPPVAAHARHVETLTGYAGDPALTVPDPYGEEVAVYRQLASRLGDLVTRVLARLAREGKIHADIAPRREPPKEP